MKRNSVRPGVNQDESGTTDSMLSHMTSDDSSDNRLSYFPMPCALPPLSDQLRQGFCLLPDWLRRLSGFQARRN